MDKWFKNPVQNKPTKLQIKHRELRDHLFKLKLRWNDLIEEQEVVASAAANNDPKATRQYLKVEDKLKKQALEIELVEMAIRANEKEQRSERAIEEEAKEERRLKLRKARLDLWEAEQRKNYEAAIDRFEREGQHNQARIWRNELSKLRQKMEERIR